MKRALPIFFAGILILLAVHVSVSYFHGNSSYLDLSAYREGRERNPFQERVGMIPVLQAAHQSSYVQSLALRVRRNFGATPSSPFREMSPEELASIGCGVASFSALAAFLIWYGARKYQQAWWIPVTVMLCISMLFLDVRYEVTLWYPYDLPHMMLFGIASVCILEGWWLPAIALFVIDVPMRETSIFLIPLWLVAFRRQRATLLLSIPMVALWSAARFMIHHRFLRNPSETGLQTVGWRLAFNGHLIINPLHLPQTSMAFIFLLLVPAVWNEMCTGQKMIALAALPGLCMAFLFGSWNETRVFSEWIPLFSVLMTDQLVFRSAIPAESNLDDLGSEFQRTAVASSVASSGLEGVCSVGASGR